MRGSILVLSAALAVVLVPAHALAQAPDEVGGVVFSDPATLLWQPAAGADDYNVYRGGLAALLAGEPPVCHGFGIAPTSFVTAEDPPPGEGLVYLVTGESAGGEGSPGLETGSVPRALRGACTSTMRAHALNRAGYGQDEWSTARIDEIGYDAYLAEQLDPISIDETTNTVLNTRLSVIDPPDDHIENFAQWVVRGTYARRQLEQVIASFFANHFNTDIVPIYQYYLGLWPPCPPPIPSCDPDYPSLALKFAATDQYAETEAFRDLAFHGTFREMVEYSAKSPAMIYYLDTFNNVAGFPNENYSRELLELHTMDVDRYSQQDVEELARVFTGWNVCYKLDTQLDDPLAPCEFYYWLEDRDATANFAVASHDCGQKVLFAGTEHEAIIPDTCDGLGQPTAAGLNDVDLALDAIVAHPATARFVAKKLIALLVTDQPTEAMIDTVVAAWNDPGNPNGDGDMREVIRAVLSLPEARDPDRVADKVKTPLEHIVSAMRATRADTDGMTIVINYQVALQHLPYFNPVPIGYPEAGAAWLDTNNTLERQNYGMYLTRNGDPETIPDFSANVLAMMADYGIPTTPGHAEEIVDFWAMQLFAGRITPRERQKAIDFLNTDENGIPADYDDARIRQTVGFMLGYPQFQEQ